MSTSVRHVEVSGPDGELVELAVSPAAQGWWEVLDTDPRALAFAPGDLIGARPGPADRLRFDGRWHHGGRRAILVAPAPDHDARVSWMLTSAGVVMRREPSGLLAVLCEPGDDSLADVLAGEIIAGHIRVEGVPDEMARGMLDPDSLWALGHAMDALVDGRLMNPEASCCGRWHAADVVAELAVGGSDAASLPSVLRDRPVVNLSSAVLVDTRAVDAAYSLASPEARVLEINSEIDETARRLVIEAVLGVPTEVGDSHETVGVVVVDFVLLGDGLGVAEDSTFGSMLWASSLAGHDPGVLCCYVPSDSEGDGPMAEAVAETFEALRAALVERMLVRTLYETGRAHGSVDDAPGSDSQTYM